MHIVSIAAFSLIFLGGIGFFGFKVSKIARNIKLGRPEDRSGNFAERFKIMMLVAFGQSKMVVRPVAGILHLFIYLAFLLTQIELLEIIIDGFTGNHRLVWGALEGTALAGLYTFTINAIEFLSLLALIATVVFLFRRNIVRIARFQKPEMKGWPSKDANIILFGEIFLVTNIFLMNSGDQALQALGVYHQTGEFVLSGILASKLSGVSQETLIIIERIGWWGHLIGIVGFMVYLPFSKHFHIFLAFPNVFFSKLEPKGRFTNLESVTKEVKLMMDPSADPYAAPAEDAAPVSFGAKDVFDLSWKQLMDAYSCTECGRCTSECPANNTGKLLSPRAIMMKTRDRIEEVGAGIDKNGKDYRDEKTLLHNYISPEELWACTTCNACVQACPVNIDPLSIIIDLRRSLVMEESAAPGSLNTMFTNVENNSAPWQFSPADRLNWATEE
ncbi:MAG: (Fe-S)-binding protein [Flavobacteriales bacterium]|nr:(Fe-S)-binding protein [Flavobacteriales bacterium]